MSQKTEPVFKLILSSGLIGLLLIAIGIFGERDLLVLSGAILVACCIHTIAKLVK